MDYTWKLLLKVFEGYGYHNMECHLLQWAAKWLLWSNCAFFWGFCYYQMGVLWWTLQLLICVKILYLSFVINTTFSFRYKWWKGWMCASMWNMLNSDYRQQCHWKVLCQFSILQGPLIVIWQIMFLDLNSIQLDS